MDDLRPVTVPGPAYPIAWTAASRRAQCELPERAAPRPSSSSTAQWVHTPGSPNRNAWRRWVRDRGSADLPVRLGAGPPDPRLEAAGRFHTCRMDSRGVPVSPRPRRAGDHLIVLGEVIALVHRPHSPRHTAPGRRRYLAGSQVMRCPQADSGSVGPMTDSHPADRASWRQLVILERGTVRSRRFAWRRHCPASGGRRRRSSA